RDDLVTGVQTCALPIFRPGGLAQNATVALVARLGPGSECALRQAFPGVGHDERLIVLQDGAEAVARRAGAPRVVEREQDRRERRSEERRVGKEGKIGWA